MTLITFSFWFMLIHTASYAIAGMVALFTFSKSVYEGKQRKLDYLRDTSVSEEQGHVSKWFIPAQLLRGSLMSVVLYPLLDALGDLTFGVRFAFFAGLVFIYTHFACAAPCSDNIEGAVYMKPRYLEDGKAFWKFQSEMIIYSLVLGIAVSYFLF